MNDIIAKAAGFVIIILLAYALKKIGVFKIEDKRVFGGMLININLPCVIISGFQSFQYDTSLVVAMVIGLFASFMGIFVGYLVSRKKDKESKILHMMCTPGYNIGIFTVPFVASFLSPTAVICVLMFDVGNAIMVFGTTAAITSAVVNKERGNPIPAILKRLFTTVPFVTYIVMVLIPTLGFSLPKEVYVITDIGANATAFLAMIMIGIMIEFKIKKDDLKQTTSALLARYGHSFFVSLVIFFLPYDIEIRKALIIAMLSPLSTSSIVFGENLGGKPSALAVFSSLNIIISMMLIIAVVVFM
ncbi:MAG: hypothetical protein R3Y09_00330 [Clostridia bacterium]